MIEVDGLYKSFDEEEVLKDINITFEKGQTNLIIGRSGSGKSVLAKCIVGLLDFEKGKVVYDERPFSEMKEKEKRGIRQEIGMLFQGSALFDSMNVEENVRFPLTMFTKKSKKEMQERVDLCLERVNLSGSNKLFPSELSGGMKKRVGIARAISMNPRYLFCDEPNSGLDPETSIVIDNLIREITYEYDMTTVVITHDMNSVIEIGDYTVFLHSGRKWWEGSKEDILHADNKELNDFVYASEFMRSLKGTFQQGLK
jgi:phospholipid/cholesterol/gamma-HCH transport system ATP-binding protein